jgi:crotonobetainyl-CoA:carnitine CoA-transferase CaiB-like acyl-CoA transferase
LYANLEDALCYDGKPARRLPDHLQRGTGATHRLYQTATDEHMQVTPWQNPSSNWVFFSAIEDDEFLRFCTVAGRDDLAGDTRFRSKRQRELHSGALQAELESLFSTRTASEWERSLLHAEVGCVIADAMSFHAFLHRSEHATSLGMTMKTNHPNLGGAYWRPAPAVNLSDSPRMVGPFVETGEHTKTVLEELGYDSKSISLLHDQGVVASPVITSR